MKDTFRIRLPYPPTINHYYVRTKKGMAIAERGRVYRQQVAFIVAAARPKKRWLNKERLQMIIRVYTPDNVKRDADNIMKCLWDSLTDAKLWGDDSQVFYFTVIKSLDEKRIGYVDLEVGEME